MEKRMTFNQGFDAYERQRSTYTQDIFNTLVAYTKLDESKKVLEIGSGTGQATQPILEIGCAFTAIEIGGELVNFLNDKYGHYTNFNAIHSDFESADLESASFDLIYSASAFHWIPLEQGMKKVCRLLKSGGVFAWISTTPIPSKDDEETFKAIQSVYSQYDQYFEFASKDLSIEHLVNTTQEKLEKRVQIFKHYALSEVQMVSFQGLRTFNAESYADLMTTYHDHKLMPKNDFKALQEQVSETIKASGNHYRIEDRYLMCMGKKR